MLMTGDSLIVVSVAFKPEDLAGMVRPGLVNN
jgi:hypothetical protein